MNFTDKLKDHRKTDDGKSICDKKGRCKFKAEVAIFLVVFAVITIFSLMTVWIIRQKIADVSGESSGIQAQFKTYNDAKKTFKDIFEQFRRKVNSTTSRIKEDIELILERRQSFREYFLNILAVKDCQHWSIQTEGIYIIGPPNKPIRVYCDYTTDGGGWTVIQRRINGSVYFFRDWNEYKLGFGDVAGEFWLGNENIHQITSHDLYELRIDLEDRKGQRRYAKYGIFRVEDENSQYLLLVFGYSGNAGDALNYHNLMKFSTKDRDNDKRDFNCAVFAKGGWWYGGCAKSNLNGLYKTSNSSFWDVMSWQGFHGTDGKYSLKSSTMMIRRYT